MNERRTMSILQRVRVILAVTAASYGLRLQLPGQSRPKAALPFRPGGAQLQAAGTA